MLNYSHSEKRYISGSPLFQVSSPLVSQPKVQEDLLEPLPTLILVDLGHNFFLLSPINHEKQDVQDF